MKIYDRLKKIENSIVFILFVVMIIAVFGQVLNRNIIKASIGWLEELARYCMIFMVILGTEMGLRDGTQISVEALTQKFSEKLRKIVKYCTRIVVIIFSACAFAYSIPLLNVQLQTNQLSPALRIPMFIPYAAITVGFGIITLVQVITWVLDLKDDMGKQNKIKVEGK